MEELQNLILELEEKNKTLELEIESLTSELNTAKENFTNLEDRNKKLEEHNQQLFLRATATFNTKQDINNENNEDDSKKVLKEFADTLGKDDINVLLNLIEEE